SSPSIARHRLFSVSLRCWLVLLFATFIVVILLFVRRQRSPVVGLLQLVFLSPLHMSLSLVLYVLSATHSLPSSPPSSSLALFVVLHPFMPLRLVVE
ncbi:hypothetical protein U1Q18_036494, partial [Sarracenia purpurea var. burkii]